MSENFFYPGVQIRHMMISAVEIVILFLSLLKIITAHIFYYFLSTGLGLIGLWRIGDSFSHVITALRRSEPPATAPVEG